MANDDKKDDSEQRVPVLPDIVPGSALMVATPQESRALARRIAGEVPPNEMRFRCITCGWDKTLKFEDDEIEALNGNISDYGGPCGECQSMTLAPYSSFFGDEFKPIMQRDKEARHKEYKEQAVVQAQTLVEEVKKHIVGGSSLDGGMTDPGAATEPSGSPAAADDTDGLTPRQG